MKENDHRATILILGNSRLVVFGFRGELIDELVRRNFVVYVAFPNGPFGEGLAESRERGCEYIEVDINRRGKNPFQDLILLKRYLGIMNDIKPDAVLAYTVKCDIYGGIAARFLGIPFFPNITGLGKALDEGGFAGLVTRLLYKAALSKANCVYFQNTYDQDYFLKHKLVKGRSVLLPGSGINLRRFSPLEYRNTEVVRFTYIARLMKTKGIEEFLNAACELKGQGAEFHICGHCEEAYEEEIELAQQNGTVVFHGLVENVSFYIEESHCVVLPTYHPEGVSNVLLEAAACARPIIATNRHGCREVVDDCKTGFLVNERDSQDLVKKMKEFIALDYESRKAMGLAGRRKVEKEFDRSIVVDEYMKALKDLKCGNE